ncbi:hypothetical protein RN001_005982 [Aquatica leii]|uniref:Uncharacterized protein n=1 Tax=Aquatica leii TaxID=1421715 RepID=A0AAN7QKP3_9COLE|nr:hypothetical protein RN001_005982 [Aquatica leii]
MALFKKYLTEDELVKLIECDEFYEDMIATVESDEQEVIDENCVNVYELNNERQELVNTSCIISHTETNIRRASRPDLLRGTQLRNHISTECAVRDLSKNVIKDVANFMGHALDIHDNIYRLPVESRDIVQMSQILEMIQGVDDHSDSDDENSCVPPLISSTRTTKEKETYVGTPENNTTTYFHDDSLTKSKKRHTPGLKRIYEKKSPWTLEEKRAALKHFGQFLKMNKLPSTSEIYEKYPKIKRTGLSKNGYYSILQTIHIGVKAVAEIIFAKSVKEENVKHGNTEDEIAVSGDGSWAKRGFIF